MHANVIALALVLSLVFVAGSMADNKRGMAGSQDPRENAMNVRWAYNWGNEPNHNVEAANFEFVPMIWSASTSGVSGQIDRILALETNLGIDVQYVLGFNEPEREDQANMTVQQALNVWEIMTDQFEGTDIKLVSPAVSGSGGVNNWLRPFMDEVESRNSDTNPNNDLRVDEIAIHWYSTGGNAVNQANNMLNAIDTLYADYGRPIWVTEFAGVDFSGNAATEERVAFNHALLEYLIPRLESRDHVTRYAWWQFGIGGNPYSQLSSLSNGVYTPTGIGDRYQDTLQSGETYNFADATRQPTDVYYMRGGTLTSTGVALDTALRAIDALEGNNIFAGTGDYGFEVADDAFVRIREGATLRKQGNNTVILPGSPVFNEGTLLIENGTMQLEGGVQLTGAGTLRVDSNGTLATSRGELDEDVDLNSSMIIMNQGLLHVKDGLTTISDELRFWNQSEVRTDGNLVVSGSTAGAGSISSTGPGILFLAGEGSHTGGTQVTEGSIFVANAEVSATGPGNILVGGSGTFGGFGMVTGDMTAIEGTVAPGVAETSSGATSNPVFDEGVVVDAIDFDFTGIQDDAPLTQTSNLSDALRIVSGLDFGPGLNPRNAVNAGNEFNVAGFTTEDSFNASSTAGDYLTFTVAPVVGLAMQLQDASFEVRRNGSGAPQRFRMFNSVTGFGGFADGRFFSSDDTNQTTFTANFTNTLPTANPVEIRLYGWSASSGAGNLRVTNVSLDASFVSDPNSVAFDPTGILELGGDYTQFGFATLEIDLGGTQAGEFDQLQVAGDVSLNGTLDVSMIDGFEPTAGQTFDIITANSVTGTFNNVIAPEGVNVQVNYTNSGVSLSLGAGLIGDFDEDGDVDVDDIDFYRLAIGLPGTGDFAQFDFNGDGLITAADMQIHIETYVQTSNGQTGTFLGDFNLDGTVNVLGDAFAMIGNLGNSVSSYADGDVNLDGIVNVLGDAFAMIGNLNRTNQP